MVQLNKDSGRKRQIRPPYCKALNRSGGRPIISVVPILVLFWDCIFMSTSPFVFHTSSAMDFTMFLYKGAKPPLSDDVVKSMAPVSYTHLTLPTKA